MVNFRTVPSWCPASKPELAANAHGCVYTAVGLGPVLALGRLTPTGRGIHAFTNIEVRMQRSVLTLSILAMLASACGKKSNNRNDEATPPPAPGPTTEAPAAAPTPTVEPKTQDCQTTWDKWRKTYTATSPLAAHNKVRPADRQYLESDITFFHGYTGAFADIFRFKTSSNAGSYFKAWPGQKDKRTFELLNVAKTIPGQRSRTNEDFTKQVNTMRQNGAPTGPLFVFAPDTIAMNLYIDALKNNSPTGIAFVSAPISDATGYGTPDFLTFRKKLGETDPVAYTARDESLVWHLSPLFAIQAYRDQLSWDAKSHEGNLKDILNDLGGSPDTYFFMQSLPVEYRYGPSQNVSVSTTVTPGNSATTDLAIRSPEFFSLNSTEYSDNLPKGDCMKRLGFESITVAVSGISISDDLTGEDVEREARFEKNIENVANFSGKLITDPAFSFLLEGKAQSQPDRLEFIRAFRNIEKGGTKVYWHGLGTPDQAFME